MIFNASGGVPLNFRVVGGTSQPTSPKENTIWVNTSVTIPSWAFSATEPESPVEGMVWVTTGTNSTVAFNALKKNALQVYPTSAKQYTNESWQTVDAQFYQSGQWVDLSAMLIGPGIGGTLWPFGWAANDSHTAYTISVTSTDDNTVISIPTGTYGKSGVAVLPTQVDLTGISTITAEYTLKRIAFAYDESPTGLFVWDTIKQGYYVSHAVASATMKEDAGIVTIDVSKLVGYYYIGFGLRGTETGSRTITIIRLEYK